jgi:hypothetical protein
MRARAQLIARGLAGGRVAIGLALLVAPDLVTRSWVGRDGRSPGGRLLARSLGARDAVIGLGALASLGDSRQLQRWLLGGVAADVADFGATLTMPKGASRTGVLAVAGGAAVAGCVAAAFAAD